MQLILFLLMLSLANCQANQYTDDLYIIAELRTKYANLYPSQHITIDNSNIEKIEICFKHKHIVPSLNPFCFLVQDSGSVLEDLTDLRSEIWKYKDLENYIEKNYDVYSEGCGSLFEDFDNVFILLKKEEKYQKLKVVRCYTFEN